MSNTQATLKIIDGPKQHYSDRTVPKQEVPIKSSSAGHSDLDAPTNIRPHTVLFFLMIAVVLFIGWRVRDEEYLTAESGLGYALGVVGLAMMVLLLLYPLRKKARFMRNWGANKYWFRAHMIMGVIGPVLILFHSNFRTGSLNSTVVFISMLLVAGSGFIGRNIYTKIHYGLYGRKMNLKELKMEIENKMNDVALALSYAPKLQQRLLSFDESVLKPRIGFMQSVWQIIVIGLTTRWTHFRLILGLRRALKVTARRAGWSNIEKRHKKKEAYRHISDHMTTALKVAEFNVYERMFALWHLFHLPLFYILVIVAALHVIAVHMY